MDNNPVSDLVTLQEIDDPEFSHEGTVRCERCREMVVIRLPREFDARARLGRAKVRSTVAAGLLLMSITAILLPLFAMTEAEDSDRYGIAVVIGFMVLPIVAVCVNVLRLVLADSPLVCADREQAKRCGHFAW